MRCLYLKEYRHHQIRTLYICIFIISCGLFWWLPSFFYLILGVKDSLKISTLITSFLGLILFCWGYNFPPIFLKRLSPTLLYDQCEKLSYTLTILISLPAFLVSILFYMSRSGVPYGTGSGIPIYYQAILYIHLFVGLLYLGVAECTEAQKRKVLAVCFMIILPRLIISLHWGRFFVAQAIIPIALIAVARGWIKLTKRFFLFLILLGGAVVFIPSLTRGDQLIGQGSLVKFFADGSTLNLYQKNMNLDLDGRCPPLLVSLTSQIVPYSRLGVCTIHVWGENLPATLDRILAYNQPGSEGNLTGPGANYLLSLYISGGLFSLYIGSFIFGYTASCMVGWISRRSLYTGIWADCLTRSFLAPRGTLGYVYQRIPSLIIATWVVVLIAYAIRPKSNRN